MKLNSREFIKPNDKYRTIKNISLYNFPTLKLTLQISSNETQTKHKQRIFRETVTLI